MDSWCKFQQLSWHERRLLLQALLILPITGLMLRLSGYRHWNAILIRLAHMVEISDPIRKDMFFQQAKKTERMVRVASSYGLYNGKCLEKSLVLWFLLRRQGLNGDLRIGARKEGDRFEAHAWVEFLGFPLDESENVRQRFKPFQHVITPLKAGSS